MAYRLTASIDIPSTTDPKDIAHLIDTLDQYGATLNGTTIPEQWARYQVRYLNGRDIVMDGVTGLAVPSPDGVYYGPEAADTAARLNEVSR